MSYRATPTSPRLGVTGWGRWLTHHPPVPIDHRHPPVGVGRARPGESRTRDPAGPVGPEGRTRSHTVLRRRTRHACARSPPGPSPAPRGRGGAERSEAGVRGVPRATHAAPRQGKRGRGVPRVVKLGWRMFG